MDMKRALAAVSLILCAFAITYLVRERSIDEPDPRPSIEGTTIPSATESPSKGQDIGLGFRVCRVTQIRGLDLGGGWSAASAWTATRMRPDDRCNRSQANSYIVAVDVDGDGLADASSRPLRHCFFCRPVAATDVDGDGDGELLVLEQGGSVNTYSFLEIEGTTSDATIRAITVAEPGHQKAGHAPGKPLRFSVGGDEGYSASATCTGYPAQPLLVVTWSNHPIDGPGSETTEVHQTTLRLRRGAFHVVEAVDTQEPTDNYRPSGLKKSRDVCGVNLSRPG